MQKLNVLFVERFHSFSQRANRSSEWPLFFMIVPRTCCFLFAFVSVAKKIHPFVVQTIRLRHVLYHFLWYFLLSRSLNTSTNFPRPYSDSLRSDASNTPPTITPKRMPSISVRPFGLRGAFSSTAASAKERRAVSALAFSAWFGPVSLWSLSPRIRPTWPLSLCWNDRKRNWAASMMPDCGTQWRI